MVEASRVLVAGADEDVLTLMALVLPQDGTLAVVGRASEAHELNSALHDLKPSLVLVDLDAPGNGLAAATMAARGEGLSTFFVGMAGSHDTDQALLALLDGVILKSDPLDRLPASLRAIEERASRAATERAAKAAMERTARAASEQSDRRPAEQKPEAPLLRPEPAQRQLEPSRPQNGSDSDSVEAGIANAYPGTPHRLPEIPAQPTFESSSFPFGSDVSSAMSSTNLVVSPFGSFRTLGAFQRALENLEGVRGIRIRRFHRGVLYAAVNYESAVPLEIRLRELTQFATRILSSRLGTIELQVETAENLVSQT